MLKIGLCGGSGVGKGYISELLKEYGFPCLDTDLLVHGIYQTDRELIGAIAKEFGETAVSSSGSVDRSILREIVFSDRSALLKLNQLVHQRVEYYCIEWMEEQQKNGAKAAFIDAPQLFEAGMEKDFDYIIAVICPVDERIERIVKRDKISKEGASKRISNQLSDSEYAQKSHFVINNSATGNSGEQLRKILCEVGLIDK